MRRGSEALEAVLQSRAVVQALARRVALSVLQKFQHEVLHVGLENAVLGFDERPQALGREKGAVPLPPPDT